MAQLAKKCNVASEDVKNVIIWGNHSSTQFPDASHASIKGKPASELIDKAWYNFFFLSDLTFDLIKIILVNRKLYLRCGKLRRSHMTVAIYSFIATIGKMQSTNLK
jgi:hypothetical protein